MKVRESSTLDANWKHYKAHQDEYVSKYDGKHLVLFNLKVMGAFDTLEDAYNFGVNTFGYGKFFLQKCSAGPKDYTVYFYSGLKL